MSIEAVSQKYNQDRLFESDSPLILNKTVRVALAALSWLAGASSLSLIAITGQIGIGVILLSSVIIIGSSKVMSAIEESPKNERIQKIAFTSLGVAFFAAGIATTACVGSTLTLTALSLQAILNLNPFLVFSAIQLGAANIGFLIPFTIKLHAQASRIFSSVSEDYAQLRACEKLDISDFLFFPNIKPFLDTFEFMLPTKLQHQLLAYTCVSISLTELEPFLFQLNTHKLDINTLLKLMGDENRIHVFWGKCARYIQEADGLMEFYDQIPQLYREAKTAKAIDALLIQISNKMQRALTLIDLLSILSINQAHRAKRTALQLKLKLLGKDKWKVKLLREKQKLPPSKAKIITEESDDIWAVLNYIITPDNCMAFLGELNIPVLAEGPFFTIQKVLEECGLATIEDLKREGILPLSGSMPQHRNLLIEKIRMKRGDHSFYHAFLHLKQNIIDFDMEMLSKKLRKYLIKLIAVIGIWGARGFSFASHPIYFLTGYIAGINRTDPFSIYEYQIPNADSISNEDTFIKVARQYSLAIFLNELRFTSGYLTARECLLYKRSAQRLISSYYGR